MRKMAAGLCHPVGSAQTASASPVYWEGSSPRSRCILALSGASIVAGLVCLGGGGGGGAVVSCLPAGGGP